MRDAHGRVGLVDVLAARPRSAIGVDLQVVLVDLDLAGVLHDGCHLDAREARLPAMGGVEWREADQPVHAPLGAEQAVCVLAPRAEGGRLDASFLARAHLEQLHVEVAPFSPAHLHAQHHLGPVLGIGPAGAGVHAHERIARVIGPGEQALLLQRREPRLDRADLLVYLRLQRYNIRRRKVLKTRLRSAAAS